MKIDSLIVNAAEEYVRHYLSLHLDKNFGFHDLSHTLAVVNAVKTICTETGIDKREEGILLVAAWFHDLGYTQRVDQHEDIGALLAEKFLLEKEVDEDDIASVKNNIIATHFPQYPLTEAERILCDADMIHLADTNYMEKVAILREEWAITRHKTYPDEEWLEINIDFLSDHRYHTVYCRQHFEELKQENIKILVALKAVRA